MQEQASQKAGLESSNPGIRAEHKVSSSKICTGIAEKMQPDLDLRLSSMFMIVVWHQCYF